MATWKQLSQQLDSPEGQKKLAPLYALDGTQESLEKGVKRAKHVLEQFGTLFGDGEGACLYTGPGRTEIGGNHTDHQHGRVLCASVDLDMLACAAPNGMKKVRIHSEGYPTLEVDLTDCAMRKSEKNTSAALVRGVAARLQEFGYELEGFDAYVTSSVLSGSGLSSSAAYEILVGNIFNHLNCKDEIDPVTLAKVGQYAENVYFGKPCGLMDQMGSSVGGAVFIDFADPSAPIVEPVNYDFSKSGHALCIVDTGSCHADLTDDYAHITQEMGAVATFFGQDVLHNVSKEAFYAQLSELREECGDRAVLRAMHFFADDERAKQEKEALKQGDFAQFLKLINASGRSSALLLQNIFSVSNPTHQAVSFALALGEEILDGRGAIRVHGGGFAGTIQAFVPLDLLNVFQDRMESVLGEGKCHILHIRPMGGGVIL